MIPNIAIEGPQITILCQQNASFQFDILVMIRLRFLGCGSNRVLSVKSLTIFNGKNANGTALEINETNTTIIASSFISHTVGIHLSLFVKVTDVNVSVGGVLFVTKSNITVMDSNFVSNSAEMGGVMYVHQFSNVAIINSTFTNNRASVAYADIYHSSYSKIWADSSGSLDFKVCGAGSLVIFQSTLIINGSTFRNNTSECDGGALSIQQHSIVTIFSSRFFNNIVSGSGGALIIAESNATVEKCIFHNNRANLGGAMTVAQFSVVLVLDSKYSYNSAKISGGAIETHIYCQLTDVGSQYVNNRAGTGGVLFVAISKVTLKSGVFASNQATGSGGVLYTIQSETMFYGDCNLSDNFASSGGAIHATESTLTTIHDTLTVVFNRASISGGGLYLYHSNLNVQKRGLINITGNKANKTGGGIHAINSLITAYCSRLNSKPYQATINFADNMAKRGGGICLESAAQLRVQKIGDKYLSKIINISMYFISNSADYGEHIYVVDETYFDVCARGSHSIYSTTASTTECFIQVLSQTTILVSEPNFISIQFTNFSRLSIVGGLLDRCTPNPSAQVVTDGHMHQEMDGFTYLQLISNINDTNSISSSPVRLCFCTPDIQPDCSYKPPIIQVKKGESFNVSIVAVDQVNHTVENVIIHSSLSSAESGLGEGQLTQVTNNACSQLSFSIYSPSFVEQLILYPEGPCRNASRSQRVLDIVLRNCTCPIGFQPSDIQTDCICICDSRLSPYFTDSDNSCRNYSKALVRSSNLWIAYINNSLELNSSGYLVFPHCPFDYCVPPYTNIQINLNTANGADAQCANNRSGILCGVCQPGLSLSLGSSHCIPCSEAWGKGFITIIILVMLAGIILVVLLMTLNLTVAVGTLNGLIFYANIIGANSDTFFSGLSSTKFLSVLISWLNQEVGVDICFFKGMDTYWKTWLQLAFPTYVILLVVVIIIVSEHSMRFSRLIAKTNPVATLATLILLSYTMFCRATITALSFATLNYPDG